ncbi:MAG: HDOD domain-containing protein [Bermanella sp.]|tara:strand:- start:287 stop:1120 length:834 start_codon:yes stop_codon:yes gene_type:complete
MKQSTLIIPPRPGILLEIQGLMQQQDVELHKITQLIKQDVSLYAILLSSVNSPWLGLRQEVKSVETAISLMGLERVLSLLQAVIIRSCFKESPLLDSFWDTASEVAGICQSLASKYTCIKVDDAYSVGMLHNSGIPIMLLNFDGYDGFLSAHTRKPANEMCVYERQTFNTDHYLQGALMAKAWYMSHDVSLAIRYQPIAKSVLDGSKELPADICQLLAVLTLAKDISGEYQHYWKVEDNEFNTQCVEAALSYLNISDIEYAEIKDDAINDLMGNQVA